MVHHETIMRQHARQQTQHSAWTQRHVHATHAAHNVSADHTAHNADIHEETKASRAMAVQKARTHQMSNEQGPVCKRLPKTAVQRPPAAVSLRRGWVGICSACGVHFSLGTVDVLRE